MSATDEEYGTSLLTPLREDALPPAAVDVPAAVRIGERRRRGRRNGAVFGAAALVLLVSAGVVLAERPWSSSPTAGPVPSTTPTRPAVPTTFDVRTLYISVAPTAGWRVFSTGTGRTGQTAILTRPGDKRLPGYVAISAHPAHSPVWVGESHDWMPHERYRTDPVLGNRAYWVRSCGTTLSCGTLVWEWAPQAWATAKVDLSEDDPAVPEAEVRRLALRFAAATAIGNHGPATVPMSAPVPPVPGYQLRNVTYRERGAGQVPETLMIYAARDPVEVIANNGRPEPVVVLALRNVPADDPNDSVNGHAATVTPTDATIYGFAGGWSLRITVEDGQSNPLFGATRLKEYAAQITVVDNPDDRSTWVLPAS